MGINRDLWVSNKSNFYMIDRHCRIYKYIWATRKPYTTIDNNITLHIVISSNVPYRSKDREYTICTNGYSTLGYNYCRDIHTCEY